MIGAEARRPSRLTVQFHRLEYWFDRQSELRRLLVGIAAILFFGSSLLYILAVGSQILVSRKVAETEQVVADGGNRSQPPGLAPTAAREVAQQVPSTPAPAPTPTPAVDENGNLIQPPDVPDVPIIAAPSRVYDPGPLKPRVGATPVAPVRTAPQVVATPAGSHPAFATPIPTPIGGYRTPIPTPGPAGPGGATGLATSTPVRSLPTQSVPSQPLPTRGLANSPSQPTAGPAPATAQPHPPATTPVPTRRP